MALLGRQLRSAKLLAGLDLLCRPLLLGLLSLLFGLLFRPRGILLLVLGLLLLLPGLFLFRQEARYASGSGRAGS